MFFYVPMKQNKKEVQSHVFEVVTFRSRLECSRCLDLHMSMRRLSSNPGCSVLIVVPMSCLRFSPTKSEKEHVSEKMSSSVKRLRFRLSTVSNRAWLSTSERPYGVSRTGRHHMAPLHPLGVSRTHGLTPYGVSLCNRFAATPGLELENQRI